MLTDENDAPEIKVMTPLAPLSEDVDTTNGHPVFTFEVCDEDTDPLMVGPGGTNGDLFSITTIGAGVYELILTQPIDYEALPAGSKELNLTIEADDGTILVSLPISLEVEDVNDTAPTIPAQAPVLISETAALNSTHANVVFVDPDTVFTTFSWRIDGTITDGAGNGNFDTAFEVVSVTQTPSTGPAGHEAWAGEVRVLDTSILDFENSTLPNTFILHDVVVVDDDGLFESSPVDITVVITDVNDEPPVLEVNGPIVIPENAANGSIHELLENSDPDSIFTFFDWDYEGAVTAGDGTGDFSAAFGVNSANSNARDGGVEVLDNTFFDFDNPALPKTFVINDVFITDLDNGLESNRLDVTIQILDVNDSPPEIDLPTAPDPLLQLFISEDAAVDDDVVDSNGNTYLVTASDADTNPAFSNWTIVSGNEDGVFKISDTGAGASGLIEVANTALLDHESNPIHTLGVRVSDGVNQSAVSTLQINVTDVFEPPEIFVQLSDGTPVPDGGSVDFGTVASGTDPTLAFEVTNQGDSDLNLSNFLPSTGFSVAASTPFIVAPGATSTFTVTMSGATTGVLGGLLIFDNNDGNSDGAIESPYEINLAGEVANTSEVKVSYLDGGEFQSGGIVNFGSFFQNEPLVKYLLFENIGSEDLTVSLPGGVTGFDINDGSGLSTTIAAGGPGEIVKVTFTTGMAPGFYDQILTATTNDADESSFDLRLLGRIRDTSNVTIIDNRNMGFWTTGDEWPDIESDTAGYLGDHEYYPDDQNAGTFGEGTAHWPAAGLTPSVYRISATWLPVVDRKLEQSFKDTFAEYDVFVADSSGTAVLTNHLNQRAEPSDLFHDGSYWNDIGTVVLPPGEDTLEVVLYAPDSGQDARVLADAVRFELVEPADDILYLSSGRDSYQFDVRTNDVPNGDLDVRAGDAALTGLSPSDLPKVHHVTAISGNGLNQVGTTDVWETSSGSSITINPDGSQTYRPADPFAPDLPGFDYILGVDPSVVFAYSENAPIVRDDNFSVSHSRPLTFDVSQNDEDPQGDALHITIDGVANGRFHDDTAATRRVIDESRLAIQVESGVTWELTLDWGSGDNVVTLSPTDNHDGLENQILAMGGLPLGVTVHAWTAPFSDRLPNLYGVRFSNVPEATTLTAQVSSVDDPNAQSFDRGFLTTNDNGTFTYTPDEDYFRAHSEYTEEFRYVATDAETDGNQSLQPAFARVDVTNTTPWVSSPRRVRMLFGESLNNDYRIDIGAFDADGDPLELVVVEAVNNGSVLNREIDAAGGFTYRTNLPSNSEVRPRQFFYRIFDGHSFSEVFETNLTVWNADIGDVGAIAGSISGTFFEDPSNSTSSQGWALSGFAVEDTQDTSAYGAVGSAVVDLNAGTFQVAQPLDVDHRQTTSSDGAFDLTYNSRSEDRQPVIHVSIDDLNSVFELDLTQELRIEQDWYRMTDIGRSDNVDDQFNSPEQIYNTTPQNTLDPAVDKLNFTLPTGLDNNDESLAERYGNGVYIWEVTATFTVKYPDELQPAPPANQVQPESVSLTFSSEVLLTDDDDAEGNPFAGFGNGWGLSGLPALWVNLNNEVGGATFQDDTAILVDPSAESRLFSAPYGANSGLPWVAVTPGSRTALPKETGSLSFSDATQAFTYTSDTGTIFTFEPAPDSVGENSYYAQLREIDPADGFGPSTTFTYHNDGRLQTITSADGSMTTFVYTGGVLDEIQMPGGRTLDATVAAATMTDPAMLSGLSIENFSRTFTYDGQSRLDSDTIGTGGDEILTSLSYDATSGTVATITHGGTPYVIHPGALYTTKDLHLPAAFENLDGTVGELIIPAGDLEKYDAGSDSGVALDDDGLRRYYFFNSDGQHTQESTYAINLTATGNPAPFDTRPQLSGDVILDLRWEWDNFDNVVYTTDAFGRETRNTYDYSNGQYDAPFNNLISTFSDYQLADFEYDSDFGRVTKAVDEKGERTDFLRNGNGQMLFWAGPELLAEQTVWGTRNGHIDIPLSQTDERGVTTTFNTYDANRRPTQITVNDPISGESRVITYDYSNAAIDVSTVGGASSSVRNTVQRTYDDLNRMTRSEVFDAGGTLKLRQTDYEFKTNGLLSEVKDGDLLETTFGYDSHGWRTHVTAGAQHSSDYEQTVTSYYSNGSVKQIQFADDHVESFYLDPKARKTWHRTDSILEGWTSGSPDFTHNVMETTSDAVGNVIQTTDRLSNITSDFEYDAYDRLTTQTATGIQTTDAASAANGLVTRYTYDSSDRVRQVTGPDGVAAVTDYDDLHSAKFSAVVVDGEFADDASITSIEYDISGNPLTTKEYRSTPGVAGRTTITTVLAYDGFGRFQQRTDPDSRTTSVAWSFDTTNNRTKSETNDRNGVVRSQLFDGAGQLRTSVSAANDDQRHTYSLAGRPEETTIHQQNTSSLDLIRRMTYGYDALGRQDEVMFDGLGGSTSLTAGTVYAFGPTGRQVTSTDAGANATVTDYDSVGNISRVTSTNPGTGPGGSAPHGAPVTTFAYAWAGNSGTPTISTTVTDPLNRETTSVSNAAGWLLESFDAGGVSQILNEYDDVGRLTRSEDALGNYSMTEYYPATGLRKNVSVPVASGDAVGAKTEYEYDSAGNMVTLTDPVGNKTEWTWDEINRRTSETVQIPTWDSSGNSTGDDFASRAWTYNGLTTVYTDRNGRTITYDASPATRSTTETWSDNRTITSSSNAVGQLVRMIDTSGNNAWTQDFDYDDLGRLDISSFDYSVAGTSEYDTEANYGYTATGVRNDLVFDLNGVQQIHQSAQVDSLNRIWQLSHESAGSGLGQRVEFTYRADSSIDSLQRNELTGPIATPASITPIAFTDYSYELDGDLQTIDHEYQSGGTDITVYDYTYDAAHRIDTFDSSRDGLNDFGYDAENQLTTTSGTGSVPAENYTYDENGNRTVTDYVTGLHNLLVSDADYNYVYDNEGNRIRRTDKTTDEVIQYDWDHRNRLTQIIFLNGSGTEIKRVEYDYNVANLRIEKRISTDGGTTFDSTERYALDGSDVVLVFDETDAVQHTYFHGPAVDQIFADENAIGEVLWALSDHQGTVRDWIDSDDAGSNGTPTQHITYSAFGEILSATDEATLPSYGYTGREWDADADLYYYRNRWYDPVIGKFANDDPIGFSAGDSNLQRYVANNAPNAVDPDGLNPNQFGAKTAVQVIKIVRDLHDNLRKKLGRAPSMNELMWAFTNDQLRDVDPEMIVGEASNQYYIFSARDKKWVDLRHFAQAAVMPHSIEPLPTVEIPVGRATIEVGGRLVEVGQSIYYHDIDGTGPGKRRGNSESTWGAEDLYSNTLGSKFRQWYKEKRDTERGMNSFVKRQHGIFSPFYARESQKEREAWEYLTEFLSTLNVVDPKLAPRFADLPENEMEWQHWYQYSHSGTEVEYGARLKRKDHNRVGLRLEPIEPIEPRNTEPTIILPGPSAVPQSELRNRAKRVFGPFFR